MDKRANGNRKAQRHTLLLQRCRTLCLGIWLLSPTTRLRWQSRVSAAVSTVQSTSAHCSPRRFQSTNPTRFNVVIITLDRDTHSRFVSHRSVSTLTPYTSSSTLSNSNFNSLCAGCGVGATPYVVDGRALEIVLNSALHVCMNATRVRIDNNRQRAHGG